MNTISQHIADQLKLAYPGVDISLLDDVGAGEAIRLHKVFSERLEPEAMQLLWPAILSYTVAYQRWHAMSLEVERLETPFVSGSNGFMQTHPAINNQQKYSGIVGRAAKQLLVDYRILRGSGGASSDGDALEEHLRRRTDTKDDMDGI